MVFYVGTYTRLGGPGVAVCALEDGAMRLVETAPLPNPTYLILSPDRTRLYAVSSDPAGAGSRGGSCAIYDVRSDGLALRHRFDTGGEGPCHLCLSPDGRFLYVANYTSGHLTVFPLDPPGPRIQLLAHEGASVHPQRQSGPHIHHVSFLPGTRTLAAVDLGIDAVVLYRQDPATGLLSESGRMPCRPGLGPRHIAYGDPGTAYLVHELGNAVSVLRTGADTMTCVQTLSTLPEGFRGDNTGAAIRVFGGHVFASNRGHDSIAVFAVGRDGLLSPAGVFATGGAIPRDFILLPDGRMLVAHQGGTVSLLQWEPEAPALTPCAPPLPIPGAVCVCPALPRRA